MRESISRVFRHLWMKSSGAMAAGLFAIFFLLPSLTRAHEGETVYLLIKSYEGIHNNIALHSLPMSSMNQCEEMGAIIATSKRFDLYHAKHDTFECITGK